MRVQTLEITNYKCFEHASLQFSPGINVLVGRNNSGKSTLMHPLLVLQQGNGSISRGAKRLGAADATVAIRFSDQADFFAGKPFDEIRYVANGQNDFSILFWRGTAREPFAHLSSREPQNFFYPFLSRRKVTEFDHTVNATTVNHVGRNLGNLYAKIDRVVNPGLPAHSLYRKACEEILGFFVSTESSEQGKVACYYASDFQTIPLSAMGEGAITAL